MKIGWFKADHWMAFGIGGGIKLLQNRLNQPTGFIPEIVAQHKINLAEHTLIVQHIERRPLQQYPSREQSVVEVDAWILSGVEGGIRMLTRRQEEIAIVPLDRNRLLLIKRAVDRLLAEDPTHA